MQGFAYGMMGVMMKHRSTTPVSESSFTAKAATVACAVLMAVSMPLQLGKTAFATNYDSQIQAAQNEASQNQNQADNLAKMADSYQAELKQLESQTKVLQEQIKRSEAEHTRLEGEIAKNKERIETNKKALRTTVLGLYTESQTSTLEMVASSKNISEFADKQAQQSAVQNKLNDTITEINKLKKQLEDQQQKVKQVLKDQKSQRAQLNAKEAEKKKLIDETKGEENAYRERAAQNNARVQQLRAAQAEENRRAAAAAVRGNGGGAGSIPAGSAAGGGYPDMWANAPLDAYVDNWGLYTRECVSYVAWKVASTGRHVPHFGGAGNANQWPSTLAQHGIQSGSNPVAGSAAMLPIGAYGHVMYVESVNGDGTITVSDYNLQWDGLYRKYTRSAAGLTYIYF